MKKTWSVPLCVVSRFVLLNVTNGEVKMTKQYLAGLAMGLFLVGFGTPGTASATLISQDLLSPADGQLTYDSDTGLSWLDLTQTVGKSYAEVAAGYGGFTTSLGFRFATGNEVGRLFTDAGVAQGGWVWGYWNFGNSGYVANSALVSLLGATSPFDGLNTYAIGNTGSNTFGTPGIHDVAIVGYNNHADFVALVAAGSTEDSQGSFEIGSFLVKERDSGGQVPEPATLALLGFGLAGLRATQRQKVA